MTDSQIIMSLSIGGVLNNSMLIIINSLLKYANRVVGIRQILIQYIIMPILQASFQKRNPLRVSSQLIECRRLVNIKSYCQFIRLGSRNVFEKIITEAETVLGTGGLEVEV